MSLKNILLISASIALVSGQRPPFAGSRPIGFPEIIKPTTEATDLGNRFGEDDISTTTVRLPIEANGDKDLVDRLSKLPKDQQPFWLLNWQALEAHRQNPQTFEQKPNVFVDPIPTNQQQQQQLQQQIEQQQQQIQQQQQQIQQLQMQQQQQQQSIRTQRFTTQSLQDLQRLNYLRYLENLEQWNQQNTNRNGGANVQFNRGM